jgi:hypothetical protein
MNTKTTVQKQDVKQAHKVVKQERGYEKQIKPIEKIYKKTTKNGG